MPAKFEVVPLPNEKNGIVKSTSYGKASFTLGIDTDSRYTNRKWVEGTHQDANSFESKFKGIKCPADKVPFIVVPGWDRKAGNRIGQCALLIDNNKNTYTYCVIGDAGGLHYRKNGKTRYWGEVSLKAAWNLGYTSKQANGNVGPYSNFTIIVFTDSIPKWNNKTSLVSQINKECAKRCSVYKQQIDNYTASSVYTIANADSDDQTTIVSSSPEDSQKLVNLNVIKQYIISIDRYVHPENVNFKYLKKSEDVVGVMIEAGYLYTSKHNKVNKFRNLRIDEQVRAINRANLPYGLYMISRANSVTEAKKELEEFGYTLNKYPPLLGAWIRIQFNGKSMSINNKILNYYREELIKLGLKSKIGIFANKEELSKITWSQHKNNWLLWYIDRIKDIDIVDEELLTPSFFDI